MVDEWSFEFLPGNSSLIFRIILPSNFAVPLAAAAAPATQRFSVVAGENTAREIPYSEHVCS